MTCAAAGTRAPAQPPAWFDRYDELSRHMDEVRRRCPRLAVLATSSVNPRNPVPADHIAMLDEPAGAPAPARLVRECLRLLAGALRDTGIALAIRVLLGARVARILRLPARVVLKTWAFGPASAGEADDFYFGSLARDLGPDAVLLCGDARQGRYLAFARAVLARPDVRAVPEWALVPIGAPSRCAAAQMRAALSLRGLARRAPEPGVALVAGHASLDVLRTATTRRLLAYHIARRTVAKARPRAYVALFEGQPWEVPAWLGAKAADPGCLAVGYQHTAITRHSTALTRPDPRPGISLPEVVMCTGDRAREIIAPGGAVTFSFGSYRRAPAAAAAVGAAPRPQRRTLLVVPEGNPAESVLLFGFAARAAPLLGSHRIVFRCHPLLPFDDVREFLEISVDALPNIEISTRPIEEDLARASALLYRGSSSVLYGVLGGLKPLYLHDPSRADVDALYALPGWRERIGTVDDLCSALERYAGCPGADAEAQWRPARDWVDAYVQPVDGSSLERLRTMIGVDS